MRHKANRHPAARHCSASPYSWLENDGWAIDASNTPNLPIDYNDGKPILFIDATRYRKQFKIKITTRRNDKQTRRLIEKWDRQYSKNIENVN